MEKDTETVDETETGTTTTDTAPAKTSAELAAEARAAEAERKAAEKEAEAERLKAEISAKQKNPPATGYTLGYFNEAEWAEAEQVTGKDRKQILSDLNQQVKIDRNTREVIGNFEAKAALKDELQDALDSDPLSPKYRGEVKKFMADLPDDILKTPADRKKWINKAIEFGKRSVKLPSQTRTQDNMDTKESGRGKSEKGKDAEYSAEEKEVFSSHGRTAEDYEKMKHPFLKDGVMVKLRPEEPKFGDK